MCHKYLDCACVFITLARGGTGAAHTLQQHLMPGKSFPSPHGDPGNSHGDLGCPSPVLLLENSDRNNVKGILWKCCFRGSGGKKTTSCGWGGIGKVLQCYQGKTHPLCAPEVLGLSNKESSLVWFGKDLKSHLTPPPWTWTP